VFERFTDRARRVLMWAQEEARLLNHSFIGSEHILLGLAREGEGIGGQALQLLGISLEAVREEVAETIGVPLSPPTEPPPFTPRAKKVLELSLREALARHHNYIGTEHLLLGLIRDGEGVACTVLVQLGADLPRVRRTVIELMSGVEQEAETVGPARDFEASSTQPAPPEEPRCPHCRWPVSEGARFRTVAVYPDVEEDADPLSMDVIYCRQCGTTLQIVRTEEPS
jgi:ATP-dependent Clp protease ATP-binding subunit ClpC